MRAKRRLAILFKGLMWSPCAAWRETRPWSAVLAGSVACFLPNRPCSSCAFDLSLGEGLQPAGDPAGGGGGRDVLRPAEIEPGAGGVG